MNYDDIIERNSAVCLSCNTEIESTHRHDFRACKCGQLCVDGGKEYLRRVYAPGALWRDTSITRPREDGE